MSLNLNLNLLLEINFEYEFESNFEFDFEFVFVGLFITCWFVFAKLCEIGHRRHAPRIFHPRYSTDCRIRLDVEPICRC